MAGISDVAGIGSIEGLNGLTGLNMWILLVVLIVMIWKLIWYGLALYKTVERKQPAWFTILFVCAFLLGDIGILAIIYLIVYRGKPKKQETPAKTKKR